jgi:hypothetical protein
VSIVGQVCSFVKLSSSLAYNALEQAVVVRNRIEDAKKTIETKDMLLVNPVVVTVMVVDERAR